MVGWMGKKYMKKINGWLDGWIEKNTCKNGWIEKQTKNRWIIVGWTGKIEGWLNGYKKCMDGWMDRKKIDKKQMGG